VRQALRAQDMSLTLYKGGLDNYLNAVVAQVTALGAAITEIGIETRRRQAAVSLIAALGGGWSTANLPSGDTVLPFSPLDPSAGGRPPRPAFGPDAPSLGPEPLADKPARHRG